MSIVTDSSSANRLVPALPTIHPISAPFFTLFYFFLSVSVCYWQEQPATMEMVDRIMHVLHIKIFQISSMNTKLVHQLCKAVKEATG